MEFIVGFFCGMSMFATICLVLIKRIRKSNRQKNEFIGQLYHESQLPIICRLKGLETLIRMDVEKLQKEKVFFDKSSLNLLRTEIYMLETHVKDTLKKSY